MTLYYCVLASGKFLVLGMTTQATCVVLPHLPQVKIHVWLFLQARGQEYVVCVTRHHLVPKVAY